jgi:hypothetical protein
MAHIQEQRIVIKFSRLVKSEKDLPVASMITEDLAGSLNAVAQELCGPGIIAEIEAVE